MTSLRFFVPGIPVGQGNHRRNRAGATYESTKGHEAWRAAIIRATRAAVDDPDDWLWIGPVSCDLVFRFPRPKSHYGTGSNAGRLKPSAPGAKRSRPDLDKLCRAGLDAITMAGGVWQDDAQVCDLLASKMYVRPNSSPGSSPGMGVYVRGL